MKCRLKKWNQNLFLLNETESSFNPTVRQRKKTINKTLTLIEHELKVKFDNFMFLRKKQKLKAYSFLNVLPLPLKIFKWLKKSLEGNENQLSLEKLENIYINKFMKKENEQTNSVKKNNSTRKDRHLVNKKYRNKTKKKSYSFIKKKKRQIERFFKMERYLDKYSQKQKRRLVTKDSVKFVYKKIKKTPPFFTLNNEFTGSIRDVQTIGSLVKEYSVRIQSRNNILNKIHEKNRAKKPKHKVQHVLGNKKNEIILRTNFY